MPALPSLPANRRALLRNWRTRAAFWFGATSVGLVAVGFAKACEWAINWHARLDSTVPWLVPLLTPVGFVLIVYLTRRFAPAARGSGIPQAIAALEIADANARTRLLSLRIAAAKIALTVLGLLCGASVGREGPTVHVGAALMDALGRYAQFPYDYVRRSLVLAGAAAGLAAAFNTPIAGIIFAVEEMARSFEERTTGTMLTAVILAGIVSVGLLGNYTYFGFAEAHVPGIKAWRAVVLCGVLCGAAGGLFALALVRLSRWIAPHLERQPLRVAGVLGLIAALVAVSSHGVTYGTGYEQVKTMLDANAGASIVFPFMKMLSTLASYLTGMPGGIFSPSLAIGAGFGADLAPLVPDVTLDTLIVLGMASYFTGVTQTPLTGAVIVMEMVGDHSLILPMLAAGFLAHGVSRLICRQPVYRALAVPFLQAARHRDAPAPAPAPATPIEPPAAVEPTAPDPRPPAPG